MADKPDEIVRSGAMAISYTDARYLTFAYVIAGWSASCRGELPRHPAPDLALRLFECFYDRLPLN
jgi:hypothetical protein